MDKTCRQYRDIDLHRAASVQACQHKGGMHAAADLSNFAVLSPEWLFKKVPLLLHSYPHATLSLNHCNLHC